MHRHATAAMLLLTLPGLARAQVAGPTCENAAAAVDSSSDVLVEVRIGRYASVSVLARPTACAGLLVPVRPIVSVAGLAAEAAPGYIAGRLPTGERLALDARRQTVRHGRSTWKVPRTDIVATVDGVMAALPVIARFLGLAVTYDEAAATVDVRHADALPVALRLAREARRAARDSARWSAARDAAKTDGETQRTNARPGIAVDYDVNLLHAAGPRVSAFDSSGAISRASDWTLASALGVAIPVARGVVESRWLGHNRLDLETASWARAWPASRRVSELRLGDVTTTGVRRDVVRGVSLTNRALVDPAVATTVRAAGRLPAGWAVEASRAGADLDVGRTADGSYTLGVPLQVGTTVVDFVAHGPQGEQRVFHQSFHTPPSFVGPGRTEYSVAAGACTRRVTTSIAATARRECDVAGNAELRYGATTRLTLRGGMDVAAGAASRRATPRPYAGIGGVLGRALVAEVAYAPRGSGEAGIASANARFEPSPSFMMAADFAASDLITVASVADLADPSDVRVPTLRYARGQRTSSWFRVAPDAWHDRVSLEGFAAASSYAGAGSVTKRVAVPLRWSALRLAPFWQHDAQNGGRTPVTSIGSDATLMAPPAIARVVGATWLRGSVARVSELSPEWSGSVVHSARRWRLELSARNDRWRPGTFWTLAVVPQLARAQASSTVSTDAAGAARTAQSVRGAVLFDARTRSVDLSSEPAQQRGGVAGTVFIDRDGDGRRSAGEPAVAGARLTIGNRIAVTDAAGEFASWGEPAHSDAFVRVDSASLASPWWIPASAAIHARIPNAARVAVDVPIVIGGIIDGRVAYADSATALAARGAVRLTLTRGGDGIGRVIDLYSDDTFYQSGLRPGTYVVTADTTLLQRRGLAADSTHVTLRGDADVGTVASVRITVRRHGGS